MQQWKLRVLSGALAAALCALVPTVRAIAAPAVGSIPTLGGDIPVVGDWDGDGVDTIGIYRGGVWYLRNSNSPGAPDIAFAWGAPDDVPVVGDWDGNGTDTIGVYRRGVWFLRNSNSAGPVDVAVSYGTYDDVPVVGDWDGNGSTTIGVFREGIWFLRNSNSGGAPDISVAWGAPSDVPVVGDWDGNGTTTFGVRRGSTFLERNSNSAGGVDIATSLGNGGDIALVGSFDGGAPRGGVRQGSTFQLPTGSGTLAVSYGLPSLAGAAGYERQVLELTNAQRAAAGCPALRSDSRLASAARSFSADMAARNYFSHTSPEGGVLADRANSVGYPWRGLGENIAAGYASAESVVSGWMNSPGHRANILNCDYKDLGVGYATRGTVAYWTQEFGIPG